MNPNSYNLDNWVMIKCVQLSVKNAQMSNISVYHCFIRMLVKNIYLDACNSMFLYYTLKGLTHYLNSETQKRLETEFSQTFLSPLIIPLTSDNSDDYINYMVQFNKKCIDPQKVTQWLRDWFCQLTPDNLSEYI